MPNLFANTLGLGNPSSNRASATMYADTLEEDVLGDGSVVSSNNSADWLPFRIPTKNTPSVENAEQSCILMSRLKEAIFESVKEDSKISRDCFCVGMDTSEGRKKRQEWLRIEDELHMVQSLASRSVQTTSLAAQQDLFDNLSDAVVDAMHYLVDGSQLASPAASVDGNPFKLGIPRFHGASRLPREDIRARQNGHLLASLFKMTKSSKYNVWASSDAARSAILQEAIARVLRGPGRNQLLKARPLLVLALETNQRAQWTEDDEKDCDIRSEQTAFLSAWNRASFGIAELITVGSGSPQKLRQAIENVLRCSRAQKSVVPVLVCVHASGDSIIPSNVSSIRKVCDTFRTQLCMEGSALAMVAQPNRPSDPEECLYHSSVLLIDPGMWFGFRMCAVITRHERSTESLIDTNTSAYSREILECSEINVDTDGELGLSMGPVLNLWTVLSRIGLARIRSIIDESTTLAERFLHCFDPFSNIEVHYEGVGCIILISYAMSMDDRLMTKQRVLDKISAANSAIYSELEQESQALMIKKLDMEEKTYLQFSPVRLLASGTLWTPPAEMIKEYARNVKETVDKYEACETGSVAFEGKAGNCRDLEFVSREENGARHPLCYGAFRVVPYELCNSWRETSSAIDVVSELTNIVITELKDSMDELISKSFLLQHEFEKAGVISRSASVRQQIKWQDLPPDLHSLSSEHRFPTRQLSKLCDGLPFVIYLNSDLDACIPDFLSVEPREACRPVEAVRQAKLAAELITAAIDALTCKWRGSNMISHIPRDLANVAGKEDFIPLTLNREGLGCADRLQSPRPNKPGTVDSPPSTTFHCSLDENIPDVGPPDAESESDETQFHSALDPYQAQEFPHQEREVPYQAQEDLYQTQEDPYHVRDLVCENSVSCPSQLSRQCDHTRKTTSDMLHRTSIHPSLPAYHGPSALGPPRTPDRSTPDPSLDFPPPAPTANCHSDLVESSARNEIPRGALPPLQHAHADTLRAYEWVQARGSNAGQRLMRGGAWANEASYRGTSLSGSTWFGSWRSVGGQRGGGNRQEREAEEGGGRGTEGRKEDDRYEDEREFDGEESMGETDEGEEYSGDEDGGDEDSSDRDSTDRDSTDRDSTDRDSGEEDSGEEESGEADSEGEEVEGEWDEIGNESEEERQETERGQHGLLWWLRSRYGGNKNRGSDSGKEEENVEEDAEEDQGEGLGRKEAEIRKGIEEERESDSGRNSGTDLSEVASDWTSTRGGWEGMRVEGEEEEGEDQDEAEDEGTSSEEDEGLERERGEDERRMVSRFGMGWLKRLVSERGTVQGGGGQGNGIADEGTGVTVMERGVSAGGIYAGSLSSRESEMASGESVMGDDRGVESEGSGEESHEESHEESPEESEEIERGATGASGESDESGGSDGSDGYTEMGYTEEEDEDEEEVEELVVGEEYDTETLNEQEEVEVEMEMGMESAGETSESYDLDADGESDESVEGPESRESESSEGWSGRELAPAPTKRRVEGVSGGYSRLGLDYLWDLVGGWRRR